MCVEKKYISFYDSEHGKKVLPKLISEIKILGISKKKQDVDNKIFIDSELSEELIFEDAGIKFKMSQLLQTLRSPLGQDEFIPSSSDIVYEKDDYYLSIQLIYNEEILGNILYYEIRINDVFDILDNAGMEIKNYVQSKMDLYKENGSLPA